MYYSLFSKSIIDISLTHVQNKEEFNIMQNSKYLSYNGYGIILDDENPLSFRYSSYFISTLYEGVIYYLDYYDDKLILSKQKNLAYFENKVYVKNEVRTTIYGEIVPEMYEKIQNSLKQFCKDIDENYNDNIRFNTNYSSIKNIIISKNIDKISSLSYKISYDNNIFEWWICSLTDINNEKLEINNATNTEAMTIFYKCKNARILKQILYGMKDPTYETESGKTSLMLCLKEGFINTALYLINTGINLDTINSDGQTALNIAIENKMYDIVKLLIKKSASLDLGQDNLLLAINTYDQNIFKIVYNSKKWIINEELMKEILEYYPASIINIILKDDFNDNPLKQIYEEDMDENSTITKIDSSLITPENFIYSIINGLDKIASYLIDSGVDINGLYKNYPYERFSTSSSLILKIIEVKTNLNIKNEIKIFDKNDFKLIKEIAKGAYGKVCLEKNKLDNIDYIVKFSISCTKDKKIDETFLKEIILMKKINKIYPDLTSKLKGMILSEDKLCVSLVLEFSGITLREYRRSLNNYDQVLIKFKTIFYQILSGIEQLQTLGIRHQDLHSKNVLVKNDKVQIIDYGISEFQEIFCSLHSQGSWFERPWIPLDNFDNTINPKLKKLVDITSVGKKNYTYDTYSVAVLICEWFYPGLIDNFFLILKNGDIYTGDSDFDLKRLELSIFPENLVPVLKKMLSNNSTERLTVSEVIDRLTASEVLEIDPSKRRKHSNSGYNSISNVGSYYIHLNKIDFNQINEMLEIYRNDNVRILSNISKDKRSFLERIDLEVYYSLNSIYNAMFIMLENSPSYENYEIPFLISTSYFDYYNYQIRPSLEENNIKIISDITTKNIEMKPVTLYFHYLQIMYSLDVLENTENSIFKILNSSFKKFLKNVDFDFNIWNVVCVIFEYHTNCDPKIANLNLNNKEIITNTFLMD